MVEIVQFSGGLEFGKRSKIFRENQFHENFRENDFTEK